MKRLNRGYSDDPTHSSKRLGYSCSFVPTAGTVEEGIAGDRDFLTKNIVYLHGQVEGSRPWSAEYVAGFLRDNGVDAPSSHFDCTELAATIAASSIYTVASTTVRREQMLH
jgi:hypothetical protein